MIIIKIGGGIHINIKGIATDLSKYLKQVKEPIVIVHGANAYRDILADQLGKKRQVVTSISGYTSVLSDDEIIDLQMMVYAGLRNKRIVEIFQRNGLNAIGLSGLDGQVIQAKRNKGIRIQDGDKKKLVRDLSGKPIAINKNLMDFLLENDYIPVLTVPIIDEEKIAVNSENDDIVGILQKEYRAELVIHFLEAPGLLEESSDPTSLIEFCSIPELIRLEKEAQGRIKRKLLAIGGLIKNGVNQVILADGRSEQPLKDALRGIGTVIGGNT